eukprot:SM005008S17866  [mRNA]  locus=s5008:121:1077:+ [translate_table: standard]
MAAVASSAPTDLPPHLCLQHHNERLRLSAPQCASEAGHSTHPSGSAGVVVSRRWASALSGRGIQEQELSAAGTGDIWAEEEEEAGRSRIPGGGRDGLVPHAGRTAELLAIAGKQQQHTAPAGTREGNSEADSLTSPGRKLGRWAAELGIEGALGRGRARGERAAKAGGGGGTGGASRGGGRSCTTLPLLPPSAGGGEIGPPGGRGGGGPELGERVGACGSFAAAAAPK